ncbi:RES domain-containing protein [Mesorhizobium sp. M0815]|uniref:RES family NAD+ phosphorylase n=1 Tax=Mesorhizobium sp. M0815 TaxID=2957005 RepID=UPI0033379B3F
MRLVGTCYRTHDPRWAFKPSSGDGAAIRGARFNPKGVPALYLALTVMTTVKEANQGFAHRIDPCVLCSYEVDCEDITDLSTKQGRIFWHACEHGQRLGHGSRQRRATCILVHLRPAAA